MTDTDEHVREQDHGTVVKFFPEKQKLYGFIKPDGGNHDVFFHANDVHEAPALSTGERVTFLPVIYKGRLRAERIQRERTS